METKTKGKDHKIKALSILNDTENFILITPAALVMCGGEVDLICMISAVLSNSDDFRRLMTKASMISMIDHQMQKKNE